MTDKITLGIKDIFSKESRKGLQKDLLWTALVSFLITIGFYYYDKFDLYDLINTVLDKAMNIIPIIVTLVLTAYTILLSIMNNLDIVAKDKEGNKLLLNTNRTFALSIIMSVVCLAAIFILFLFCQLKIEVEYNNIINHIGLFFILIFMSYPFISLINIVIDIFNTESMHLIIINKMTNKGK